jgi:hypothetical protein
MKMNLQDLGWGGMDWIDLAQDGGMNEPSGFIKCGLDPD